MLQGGDPKIAGNPLRAGITATGAFVTGLPQEPRRQRIAHLHPCFTQAGSCRSNGDAQHPCGFRCVEILDVLHEKHFTIWCGESFNRTPQRITQFLPPKRLPGDSAPVRQVFWNLIGWRFATERPLGRKRSEDLFKTGCRNRKCFCAHTVLDKQAREKLHA